MMTNNLNDNKDLEQDGNTEFWVPYRFLSKPFMVNDRNENAFEKAYNIVHSCSQRGLYLFGRNGIGKSHLAAWTMTEWCRRNESTDAIYANFPDLMSALYNNMGMGWGNEEIIRKAVETRLLVLDDIGAENTNIHTNYYLYLIVNGRYENDGQIIVTTNYGRQELAEKVGNRVVSRLSNMCDVIEITSEDRRIKS